MFINPSLSSTTGTSQAFLSSRTRPAVLWTAGRVRNQVKMSFYMLDSGSWAGMTVAEEMWGGSAMLGSLTVCATPLVARVFLG